MSPKALCNYVGGKWLDVEACERSEVSNPAAGEVLALAPRCGAEEVDRAVAAASVRVQSGEPTKTTAFAPSIAALSQRVEESNSRRTIVPSGSRPLNSARWPLPP